MTTSPAATTVTRRSGATCRGGWTVPPSTTTPGTAGYPIYLYTVTSTSTPPPQRRRGDQDIRERGAAGRGRQAEQRRRGGGEAVRGGETEREGDRDLHRHQQGDEDIQGEDIYFILTTVVTEGRSSIESPLYIESHKIVLLKVFMSSLTYSTRYEKSIKLLGC